MEEAKQGEQPFVGLSNQGATCYMNSLLQTLFMTPEFREGIYSWKHDPAIHGEVQDSIPLQLQTLFGFLQVSKSKAVTTKALTKSFQWDPRESFQQHDVQEFCRVLFDAIERSIVDTEQCTMIKDLYQGTSYSYVKCLKCNNESKNEDVFLDISLTVKNNFDNIYNESIQQALENYIKPEKLEGDNQYACAICGEKTDALKGISFSQFPYILTLQLKRFDLDYATMSRVKLNDKVEFPNVLNIAPFVTSGEEVEYELFSIMIHSGGAHGGHYFAYIKDFASKNWFNFNDGTVTQIDDSKIEEAYGGITKTGKTGTNAYLLAYRRVDQRNIASVDASLVPENIHELERQIREQEEKEAAEEAERVNNLIATVFLGKLEKRVPAKLYWTMEQFKKACMEQFSLQEMSDADVRVRAYSRSSDLMAKEYGGEKEAITLRELEISNFSILALELKKSEEAFEPYDENTITIKVVQWDEAISSKPELSLEQKSEENIKISLSKEDPVLILRQKLASQLGKPEEELSISKRVPSTAGTKYAEFLCSPDKLEQTLAELKIYEGMCLYLEPEGEKKWEEQFEIDANKLNLKFNHPDNEPDIIGNINYDKSILVDRRQTVGELRQLISDTINVDIDKFIAKRNGFHGNELKQNAVTIQTAGIPNNGSIYLSHGTPSKDQEYKLIFSYINPTPSDYEDGACYNFVELFEVAVSATSTVAEAKEVLCQKANTEFGLQLTPSTVRLRDRNADRVNRHFPDKLRVKDCNVFDKKNLLLQDCPEGEDITVDHFIMNVKVWKPSEWTISPPFEFIVHKTATFHEFGSAISAVTQIPLEHLEVCKIAYTFNFVRGNLLTESFVACNDNQAPFKAAPWNVNMGGGLFVAKSNEEITREMTEEEKDKYLTKKASPPPVVQQFRPVRRNEKPIIITVKGKE